MYSMLWMPSFCKGRYIYIYIYTHTHIYRYFFFFCELLFFRIFYVDRHSESFHKKLVDKSDCFADNLYHSVSTVTILRWRVTWCTNSLTFNNRRFCPHCIYVFCIYLRTNSDLCHLQHRQIGFYNRDETCLLRGTYWVFKYNSLHFVFKGLIKILHHTCCHTWQMPTSCFFPLRLRHAAVRGCGCVPAVIAVSNVIPTQHVLNNLPKETMKFTKILHGTGTRTVR